MQDTGPRSRKHSFSKAIQRRGDRLVTRMTESLSPPTMQMLMAANPFFRPVDALAADLADRGRRFVSFAHYDYLGLAHDPRVIEAGINALQTHGSGAGASRLVGGERLAHRDFERELAEFLGVGATLCVISGYLTNLSLITHLLDSQDLLLIDDLSHNSIMAAARAGRFQTRTFAHNDCDDLDRILSAERAKFRQVLIVTEGLFSMDGDFPDLPRLIELRDRHDAWLMLDEAHSYGVLGPRGRGLCDHFGIDPALVDISVGTLSKSLASSGGFIAASPGVIEYLRYSLPGFIYSVGLSPVTVATARAALSVLRQEPDRVTRLHANARHFLNRARETGFDTAHAQPASVVPILFPDAETTLRSSTLLEEAGIYAPPVVVIGVPTDKPRIRFFLSAAHTTGDIDTVFDVLSSAR